MYRYDARVGYSEIDAEKCLSLPAIIDYFQNCSTFQSEDLGIGYDFLEERGLFWVINSWQIIVDRCPRMNERITVGTAPYKLHGFLGYRNFYILSEAGEYLVRANSLWSLIARKGMKPAPIPQELIEGYRLKERLEMDYAPRKIRLPREAAEGEQGGAGEDGAWILPQEPLRVRPYHLDPNRHVNNGQYIKIAGAYLPEGFKIREFRAEYREQAFLGDTIHPVVCREDPEGGEEAEHVVIALNDTAGKPYSIAEFIGTRSGEKC